MKTHYSTSNSVSSDLLWFSWKQSINSPSLLVYWCKDSGPSQAALICIAKLTLTVHVNVLFKRALATPN